MSKNTKEMTMEMEMLVAIKNGETFRTKTNEGVILEGKLSDLLNFVRRYDICEREIVSAEETNSEEVVRPVVDRKAAAEVYNTTEGSKKFEVHEKNGTGLYDPTAHARREVARDAARADLAALKGIVTPVNLKPSLVKIMNVMYIPEKTFIPSEAKKTKTSRLLVEVKTSAGERHLINIADFFHSKVGRCSAKRTSTLIEKAQTLVLDGGKLTEDSLQMWFVLANLM